MIKIGNTYIPNQPVILEVKGMIQRSENQFELILQHRHPELEGRIAVYQASIKFETEQQAVSMFKSWDSLYAPNLEIQEIPSGSIDCLTRKKTD